MTPNRLSKRVVSDRLSWVERMISDIRTLPLDDQEAFFADQRNVGAAESYLLADLERIAEAYRQWLREHEEWLDETL